RKIRRKVDTKNRRRNFLSSEGGYPRASDGRRRAPRTTLLSKNGNGQDQIVRTRRSGSPRPRGRAVRGHAKPREQRQGSGRATPPARMPPRRSHSAYSVAVAETSLLRDTNEKDILEEAFGRFQCG